MRFVIVGAIATAIAVGAVTGGGGGLTANIWVAANGSNAGSHCAWSVTPIANPDPTGATLCLDADKANQLGACGGTVRFVAGTWLAAQSITHQGYQDSCTAGTRVSYLGDGGASSGVYMPSLAVWGRHVLVDGLNGDPNLQTDLNIITPLPLSTHPRGDDVVTQHMVWSNGGINCVGDWTASYVEWNGANSDSLVNGIQISRSSTCTADGTSSGTPIHDNNIVWDHVTIHDIRCPIDGTPANCAHQSDGVHVSDFDGFTITNSRFYNNGSAQVFFKGNANDVQDNLTFTNNWVSTGTCTYTTTGGPACGLHEFDVACAAAAGGALDKINWLVNANAVNGDILWGSRTGLAACPLENDVNIRIFGNYSTRILPTGGGPLCAPGNTNGDVVEDYNATKIAPASGGSCGAHDVVENPLKFVSVGSSAGTCPACTNTAPDLHVQAGSASIDLVPTSFTLGGTAVACPATDFDGNPRPDVAEAVCDANAGPEQ